MNSIREGSLLNFGHGPLYFKTYNNIHEAYIKKHGYIMPSIFSAMVYFALYRILQSNIIKFAAKVSENNLEKQHKIDSVVER